MENTIERKYGLLLLKTNRLVSYRLEHNDGCDDCCGTSCYLIDSENYEMWLVEDPRLAAYVRQFSTQWYNAEYETPNHPFKPEELQVVEVIKEITIKNIDVKIPTVKEHFIEKYGETEPKHLAFLLSEIDAGSELRYSWCDIM